MTAKWPEFRREATAGVTTFFTMAYIVVVNPAILSSEGTGMPFSGVMTATVLLSASMTLLMGVYARLPFAVAPGMGINAFFAYSIILGQGVPWPQALGIVFWAGVLFLAISVVPLREAVARAIPGNLRIAAAAGIGIFLTFIGLKNAGIVVSDPATLVKLGPLGLCRSWPSPGWPSRSGCCPGKVPWLFWAGFSWSPRWAGGRAWSRSPRRWSAPPISGYF